MSLPQGLYAIADAGFGDPYDLALALARNSCPLIQLRAKGWPKTEVTSVAARLVGPIHEMGAKLIINDHADIAAEVGADGVHIGQEDGSVDQARSLLGPDALIGLSTHTISQVLSAGPADYIGFGPVFTTSTKDAAGSPRGVDALRSAVQASKVPVIAIGGITHQNLASVQSTGAHGWAIVRDLLGSGSLEHNLQRLSIQP